MKSFMFILFLLRFLMPGLAMAGAYNYSSMDFINQGSAQVGRNYIKNGGGEVNKLGWSTFADAAATTPADGTGGSPNSTWTTTTSSPLRGSGSFLWTKSSGASRQGEGVSYDFTIDASDKGKVLQIKFDYAIASGTFVDDDMTVWVYDVTNGGTPQQVAPTYLKNHSLASETFGGEFQTATSSTSYRLILYVPVTTNSANTVKFDNFSIGPANLTRGPPVTDWTSYTPSTNGLGTVTIDAAKWRRVGDTLELEVSLTTGTVTASTAYISLPTGLTPDNFYSSTKIVGHYIRDTSNEFSAGPMLINTANGNYLFFGSHTNVYSGGASPLALINGNSLSGNTNRLSLRAAFKVTGWSSSAIMSSDADTRVTSFSATKSSTQTVGPNNSAIKITWDVPVLSSGGKDTHGVFDDANDRYVVAVPGDYQFNAQILLQATNVLTNDYDLRLYKNGSLYRIGNYRRLTAGVAGALNLSTVVPGCIAGDYFEVYIYGAGNNSVSTLTVDNGYNGASFTGFKLSGPAQIAASETVAARYYVSASTANTSFADDVAEIVDADTKIYDTHGAVTTGASWKFTMPIAGKYHVCVRERWANGTNLVDTDALIYKNGSLYIGAARADTSTVYDINGCVTMNGVAGDYIQWYGNQNDSAAGARNIATTGNSFIDIYRIGN